jgi:hypothetical protein
MKFVLLNESKVSDAAHGGHMTPAILGKIASASTTYLNQYVAAFWGGMGTYAVRAGAGKNDVQPGEIACAFLDALPDAPGAVAYHDVTGKEVPVIFLARTLCNSLLSGADSVSSALSHELAETVGDPACNLWARDTKYEWAHELCDAVQEWGFEIDGVAVSDFVLPAFFAPGSAGPWNYLGTKSATTALKGALATAPGGYQIRSGAGGHEVQVQGEVPQMRLARKRNWSSRTYRRGARV